MKHFEPLGLLVVLVLLRALTLSVPAALRGAPGASTRYVDAAGVLLREVRPDDGRRARPPAAGASHSLLADALVLAEDRRFRLHPGIDPVGVARAAWHDLQGGPLQGASTLTMQLARAVAPHPRTLLGKLDEAALALRLEASLSKDEILTAYLAEAPFGPQLRGAEAAAEQLFGKPTTALSPAEAATLAALPKAPGLFLTDAGRARLRLRRDHLLRALAAAGRLDRVALARAEVEPLPERLAGGGFAAPHLIEAVRAGRFGAVSGEVVPLTVSLSLQTAVQAAVRAQVDALAARHVSAGAAVVLDNRTGQILAYVGSPDFGGPGGQNDGVWALRQPGSALKPFVYALALDAERLDPATVLPDVPLRLEGEDGVFAPQNYDGVFHGPVRAREALGNSYNVPAVWLADRLGTGPVLELLHRLGFTSLGRGATHYGAALALGDGEVRLLELAAAYATLARDGWYLPPRAVQGPPDAPTQVVSADAARLVTDMLADRHARGAAFGAHSVLEFSYPVAAKTGTSKGFRDNVTAGFSSEVTVVAWVGNFDGSPMQDVSGIAGAGPLFHAVLELAMQGRSGRAFAPPAPGRFVRAEVCPLSGARAGAACPHRIDEWVRAARAGDVCMMHEFVDLAPDGLRAGPGCVGTARRAFERYDGTFAGWAESARRTQAPRAFSPRCPGALEPEPLALKLAFPRDGARFQWDPGRAGDGQKLRVHARGETQGTTARLDGVPLVRQDGAFWIPLARGEHELVLQEGARSDRARYVVR